METAHPALVERIKQVAVIVPMPIDDSPHTCNKTVLCIVLQVSRHLAQLALSCVGRMDGHRIVPLSCGIQIPYSPYT